jgi:hypothetical protein
MKTRFPATAMSLMESFFSEAEEEEEESEEAMVTERGLVLEELLVQRQERVVMLPRVSFLTTSKTGRELRNS